MSLDLRPNPIYSNLVLDKPSSDKPLFLTPLIYCPSPLKTASVPDCSLLIYFFNSEPCQISVKSLHYGIIKKLISNNLFSLKQKLFL